MAENRAAPVPPETSLTTVVMLPVRVPLDRPTTVPTMAMRKMGMSLMTVALTWNLPASLGDRALRT